jgi:hypothetical protein
VAVVDQPGDELGAERTGGAGEEDLHEPLHSSRLVSPSETSWRRRP